MNQEEILQISHLKKYFSVKRGFLTAGRADLRAVDDVNLTLHKGETLGIVGESGCGKSTLGKTILRIEDPTDGRVLFRGKDVFGAKGAELLALRREIQMVFQDPYSSLNPRMTIGEIIREPLDIHRMGTNLEREERVSELLRTVGLPIDVKERYPHEFSGGQRQRIGIARALALKPEVIIADEPVSALDVSVQAQILNLIVELQKQFGLSYLFISHDLKVVEYVSDRVAVMYLGRIVEEGPSDLLFANPRHPYTRALMASSPVRHPADRQEILPIQGEIPSAINPPRGCHFHPRCPFTTDKCKESYPSLDSVDGEGSAHRAACFHQSELPTFIRAESASAG